MHLVLLAMLCAGLDTNAARAIFAKAQKSVVTVKLVVKISANGHDQEQKVETFATVIDAQGLMVLAAAAVDPAAMMRQSMRGRPGSPELKFESSVTESTVLLPDGTEIDADVVLKDADLDLAFLRPREDGRTFDFVTLKPVKTLPAALEPILLVGRFGQNASRQPWMETVRMKAVVKGPRIYGLVDSDGSEALGTVAYALDGTPLGVFVTKTAGSASEVRRMGGGDDHVILRTADDVLEIAEQARKRPRPPPPSAVAPVSKPAPAPAKE
jgi:hypothetical protein